VAISNTSFLLHRLHHEVWLSSILVCCMCLGNKYEFLFMAKGGGSANKTSLYQQARRLINPAEASPSGCWHHSQFGTWTQQRLRTCTHTHPFPSSLQTKALLNPGSLAKFLDEKIKGLGTAACPPYHLAVVIGGMSAEYNLKVTRELHGVPGAVLHARSTMRSCREICAVHHCAEPASSADCPYHRLVLLLAQVVKLASAR
jgi:hypothetical protein